MNESHVVELKAPAGDALSELLKEGARQLLAQAIEAEVAELLAQYAGQTVGRKRAVVRNGYLPERTLQTGLGDVPVKVPKSVQPKIKSALHEIWMAETQEHARKTFDRCVKRFEAKHAKAMDCLVKDKESMLAFYDFPAVHWQHIRTTNPIESVFATVRLRTTKTKNGGSRMTTLAMAWKLMETAQNQWRRLRGYKLLADEVEGVKFKDGERVEDHYSGYDRGSCTPGLTIAPVSLGLGGTHQAGHRRRRTLTDLANALTALQACRGVSVHIRRT